MLDHTIVEQHIDVVIVAEPNKKMVKESGWMVDSEMDTAIGITNKNLKTHRRGEIAGFSWIETEGGLLMGSCYYTPNNTTEGFEDYLQNIRNLIRSLRPRKCIVAGDFNAKSHAWDTQREDERGVLLEEWLAELDLFVVNTPDVHTFARDTQVSVIDITARSEGVSVIGWRVSEEENLSDHRTILYKVSTGRQQEGQRIHERAGWFIRESRMCSFVEKLNNKIGGTRNAYTAGELQDAMVQSCNSVFTRKGSGRRKRTMAYWWNEEIAAIREECVRARRRMTRAMSRQGTSDEDRQQLKEAYKLNKNQMRKAIEQARKKCWKDLVNELDGDIWGRAFQIVRRRYGVKHTGQMTDEEMLTQARKLFPEREEIRWRCTPVQEVEPFTGEELRRACTHLKSGKAPGPDGLPNEVVKRALLEQEEYCLRVFNRHIGEGTFPRVWKDARLVLIEKPKKEQSNVAGYRPICLMGNIGKVYERLINQRLIEELDQGVGLHEEQYGFRKGRSTTDAIARILKLADTVNTGPYKSRRCCVLVTLDIRNAFNSAPWEGIIKALHRKGISAYLVRVIKAYLSQRTLQVGEAGHLVMTCGVPQGSVLGPTLWNIYYDGVLRLRMPEGVTQIAYADDLALVVEGRSEEDIGQRTTMAIERIVAWMSTRGLTVAPEKTEAVVLVGRRKVRQVTFKIRDETVTTAESVNYLGVRIGRNLGMNCQIKHVQCKAAKITADLNRIMTNVEGPRTSKRRLLVSAILSVVLYAAPAWGKRAIKHAKYRRALTSIQRNALIRMTRAYRTVSGQALCVVGGIPPVHLLIEERARIYEDGEPALQKARTAAEWQAEWTRNNDKGQWTKKLIPQIDKWAGRQFGELTYATTQLLTGHGCFRKYLFRFKRARNQECPYCGEVDDAEHTFFVCPRWADVRGRAATITEGEITPENLLTHMLKSEENWKHLTKCWDEIVTEKEREERDII